MEQIAAAFLDPADGTVVGWPSFFKYVIVTQIMGGTLTRVPMVDMQYDLPGMADVIGPGTRLVFIANPNNPTGTMVTAEEMAAFLDLVPEHVIVVFDEAYYEYIERNDYPDSMAYVREGRNVIILRTFSKIYGLAGMRIGYGIAKPEIIASLNRVRETFNTNSLAQVAALHALDDRKHVERSIRQNREERARLTRELSGLGLIPTPSVTNFILTDMGRDAADLYTNLLREGVIIRPMKMYDLPDAMRITVGTPDENDRLLERLAKVL
jgi:histidinol-phosphate aminotransferase